MMNDRANLFLFIIPHSPFIIFFPILSILSIFVKFLGVRSDAFHVLARLDD